MFNIPRSGDFIELKAGNPSASRKPKVALVCCNTRQPFNPTPRAAEQFAGRAEELQKGKACFAWLSSSGGISPCFVFVGCQRFSSEPHDLNPLSQAKPD